MTESKLIKWSLSGLILVIFFWTALIPILGQAQQTNHDLKSRVSVYDYRTLSWVEVSNPQDTNLIIPNEFQEIKLNARANEGVVGVGQVLWDLVRKNSPAANIANQVAHVLPSSELTPMQLTGWKSSKTYPIKIEVFDFVGGTVVKFIYWVSFSFGGQHNGKGKYLANVTVVPSDLEVKALFEFNAQVQVLSPTNKGNTANPLAALNLMIKTSTRDLFLGGEKVISHSITLDGEGHWSND